MAASGKVQVISTKYFMCINSRVLCDIFAKYEVCAINTLARSQEEYTDDTYATKPALRSHIRVHFMNHDYIGSFWQCQMSQKWGKQYRMYFGIGTDFFRGNKFQEMLCPIILVNMIFIYLLIKEFNVNRLREQFLCRSCGGGRSMIDT